MFSLVFVRHIDARTVCLPGQMQRTAIQLRRSQRAGEITGRGITLVGQQRNRAVDAGYFILRQPADVCIPVIVQKPGILQAADTAALQDIG